MQETIGYVLKRVNDCTASVLIRRGLWSLCVYRQSLTFEPSKLPIASKTISHGLEVIRFLKILMASYPRVSPYWPQGNPKVIPRWLQVVESNPKVATKRQPKVTLIDFRRFSEFFLELHRFTKIVIDFQWFSSIKKSLWDHLSWRWGWSL